MHVFQVILKRLHIIQESILVILFEEVKLLSCQDAGCININEMEANLAVLINLVALLAHQCQPLLFAQFTITVHIHCLECCLEGAKAFSEEIANHSNSLQLELGTQNVPTIKFPLTNA